MMVGPLCSASNRYQAKLSLPVCGESSNHFSRPIGRMVVQLGRSGIACLVCIQSASISRQLGAMPDRWTISACMASRLCGGLVMMRSALLKWVCSSASLPLRMSPR